MREKGVLVFLTMLLVLTLTITGYAQKNIPFMLSTDNVKIGSWAKLLQYNNGEKTIVWLGAVGEKTINGVRYVWLEMRTSHNNTKIITKMLLRFSLIPRKVDIKRIVFKQGNKPAMEIPVQMASMAGNMLFTPVAPDKEHEYTIKTIGKEVIKVPAGTIATTHIRLIRKVKPSDYIDVWENPDVLTKVVKVKDKEGVKMLLLAYGNGAKTAITEKPKKLNIPFPSN